ncbi:hypothetical protein [Bacillus sp. OTU530]|jgi:hypothetical protein|uniref:Uncharacterized protein n=1 Tax=Ectobacillus funiculus TaxID=137993 RepID=A0ABV5W9I9_9BACI
MIILEQSQNGQGVINIQSTIYQTPLEQEGNMFKGLLWGSLLSVPLWGIIITGFHFFA